MRKHPTFSSLLVGEPDANPRDIPERVVQEVWRRQQFDSDRLRSTAGSEVIINDPGTLNLHQGPDFAGAAVRIDGVLWRGAVEIHKCSADWYRHGHDGDPLYNNVVLHVTLIADRETGRLRRHDRSLIPEIVLMPRLKTSLRKLSWDHEVRSHFDFPCETFWPDVPSSVIDPFLHTLVRDRLREKSVRIASRFDEVGDLDQVLYEEIFRSLGYMPNAEPMVLLARRVTLNRLRDLGSSFDHTCVLLGVAGLLPRVTEYVHGDRSAVEYSERMKSRFEDLRHRLAVPTLPRQTWRFSRMRPNNFPPLRIAQAAALFGTSSELAAGPVKAVVRELHQSNPTEGLHDLLSAEPDAFWRSHATLLKRRRSVSTAALGSNRKTTIVVNAVAPVLSFHNQRIGGEPATVANILERLPAQSDSVTRPYTRGRGRPTSAAVTQALHELAKNWCRQDRCLECPVGRHLSREGCRFDT